MIFLQELMESHAQSLLGIAAVFLGILWILSASRLRALRQNKEAEIEALKKHVDTLSDKIRGYEEKFAPTFDQENTVARLKADEADLKEKIEAARVSYREKRAVLEKLESQVAVYDDRLAFAELGIYEPHFDFTDSEAFQQRIKGVREKQKAMVSAKSAALCPADWTLDGSKSKGQTMINRQMRLSLRAFNNECDAAIANARWNNVVAMEKRILAAEKAINRENSSMKLTINADYVILKIEELRLTHEYREQQKAEKEERAEMKRAEREEQKLLAEAEAADKEERKYQALLDKARQEAGVDEARIAELEAALAEAHAASERARAMAEMTKSGYVYVISNIGSFGEDVVKIGLTRRLEPDDRVRELGDASVPFGFDTHAMIYSDEAPSLETALHREFVDRRINMSNLRKEFFRVSLDEVESAVTRLAPNASFFKDREAQEWHETLARRNQSLIDMRTKADSFPKEI
jgi:septal ring factor EnvC (AmiA/AmiB activator)